MTDVHSKPVRRKNMKAVRAKNTKPELLVRKLLHGAGYRYRLHVKNLPGTPDIVLPKYKVVIFVHGCFWHMHDCALFRLPATRTDWWRQKLTENRLRSEAAEDFLRELGWRVVIVWECSLKGQAKLEPGDVLDKFTSWLSGSTSFLEIPESKFSSLI
ncbi:very short patch repair endonuclease [Alteromonas lipolytica]|uniref:Very short patch repair endonuclease n=1 Tax=Alteromonas lipolytica TaxID=1856405 RepID=A0A1E8FI59_9ALTE|nr:DNA mismatch endonuclease Vsr [Alteromonas lipolytica]OFI35426.1 very short patch repair endonuclease [Alteromonas lipolytica]